MEPYGATVFCDDIRFETNGKLTLIGCYSGEMTFNGPAPGILPTFAAFVMVRVPVSVDFKRVSVVVFKHDGADVTELLRSSIEVERSEIDKIEERRGDIDSSEKVTLVSVPCQWQLLQFSAPGFVKVRAYLDDEKEIKVGALRVNFAQAKSEVLA